MNFLLFFQIQSTDEIAVLLSQSFLDLFKVRNQLFKSKQGDFIKRVCVCTGVDCTDASEIPKQYKAWLVSIRQGLKKLVEGGRELSAVTTTAAIQLEMDNSFAPMCLCLVSFQITVNSPVSSACRVQSLSVLVLNPAQQSPLTLNRRDQMMKQ